MRARPASPAAPAPSPSSVGYHSSGAPQHSEFTAWGPCFHLSLGCPFQVLSCGHGQAAWALLLAGVVWSGSSICYLWIFFHLEESPGDRGVTGGGGKDSPSPSSAELLGTPSPGSGRGQPVLPAPLSPFRAHLGAGDLCPLCHLCPQDALAPLPCSSSS